MLFNLCTRASLLLASKWKTEEVPCEEDWLAKVRYLLLMNKLLAIALYQQGNDLAFWNFKKDWADFF